MRREPTVGRPGPARHRPSRLSARPLRRPRRPQVAGSSRSAGRSAPTWSTARTEVVTTDGVVTPGFVDAHVHPVMGGLNRLRCDLDDLHDLHDYRRRIAVHAGRPGDWLVGSGWYGDVFPGGFPTAEELDALTGDRPGDPDQPRRAQRLGQHRGPAPGRDRPAHPGPRRGPDPPPPRRSTLRPADGVGRRPRHRPGPAAPAQPSSWRRWSRRSATSTPSASSAGRTPPWARCSACRTSTRSTARRRTAAD